MNLSLVEKKCTVDYLERLIPKQRAALTGIIDGGLQDVEGQVETIEYTLQFIDKGKEAYNYDSILKVLKSEPVSISLNGTCTKFSLSFLSLPIKIIKMSSLLKIYLMCLKNINL